MTDQRFNCLMNEALYHPLAPFRITRLMLALQFVIDGCGDKARNLLEAWTQARNEQDGRSDTSVPGHITRLALALKYVVDGCGKPGSDLLEAWCESRNKQDNQPEEEDAEWV